MDTQGSPQITRRTTRSAMAATNVNSENAAESSKTIYLQPLTVNDLVCGKQSINFDELISYFPGRRGQIVELIRLLGPVNSPVFPLFIYGGSSTGKTSVLLDVFRYLRRPFVYSSCITCHNPRILFESVLNQVLLHRKSQSNGYSSAKRCEKPSDFINHLREALDGVLDTLRGNMGKSSSKKDARRPKGEMIYLIFDNLEFIREWDKSTNILPFLFKLHDILRMPQVGLIFISGASPDTYYSDTGHVEPMPVYFPDYTEDELRQILVKNQANKKLYSSFLDLVLKPFYRITRRVNELSAALSPLYIKYCEPFGDLESVPNENMKRKLFCHFQPYIAPSLNETFRIIPHPSSRTSAYKGDARQQVNAKKFGACESSDDMDLHMSISAKYLLISAFLASRNPATLDATLFDSTGGSDNRKRKRKSSEKSMEQRETSEQEALMKGPGTFPLERLLAIFQCLTSVADYPTVEESQTKDGMGGENFNSTLMSDVLLQLSSLCNANFISKGASCPLEGSTRYRSTVSEDMALKAAKSLKFPLSKYLYNRR